MADSVGIDLKIVWFDDDMLELQVTAKNGLFAGKTTFYDSFECIKDLANHMAGFPTTSTDVRKFALGETDLDGHGGVSFTLNCADKLGHLNLEVLIIGNDRKFRGMVESSKLCIPVEPAAIDSFVDQLQKMKLRVGDAARISLNN